MSLCRREDGGNWQAKFLFQPAISVQRAHASAVVDYAIACPDSLSVCTLTQTMTPNLVDFLRVFDAFSVEQRQMTHTYGHGL